MNTLISAALLILGAMLIIYGINASDSIDSTFSRLFTGAPTDKTIWLIVGGTIASIIGLFGLFRSSNNQ